MQKPFVTRNIFAAVALISVVAFPLTSLAAEDSVRGLTISPLTFELVADPRDTTVNELKVFNPTQNTFSVKMEVEDFTPVGEEGQVVVEATGTETYSLKHWVTFEPQSFTVEPGEKQFVRFTIAVPENAEPGGHYGSVLASTVGTTGEGTTGAGVGYKVGSLVLLTVSGVLKESLAVEFDTADFHEKGPIPFDVRLANNGTVHVRPLGFAQITNIFGKKVEDVPFPQKSVIPGAKRTLQFAWDAKGFKVGRYSASLVGSYGQTNTPLSYTTTFWIVPWKQLSLMGFVVLAAFVFFLKTRKRLTLAVSVLMKGTKAGGQ